MDTNVLLVGVFPIIRFRKRWRWRWRCLVAHWALICIPCLTARLAGDASGSRAFISRYWLLQIRRSPDAPNQGKYISGFYHRKDHAYFFVGPAVRTLGPQGGVAIGSTCGQCFLKLSFEHPVQFVPNSGSVPSVTPPAHMTEPGYDL